MQIFAGIQCACLAQSELNRTSKCGGRGEGVREEGMSCT